MWETVRLLAVYSKLQAINGKHPAVKRQTEMMLAVSGMRATCKRQTASSKHSTGRAVSYKWQAAKMAKGKVIMHPKPHFGKTGSLLIGQAGYAW
jgi:hypothetical protein